MLWILVIQTFIVSNAICAMISISVLCVFYSSGCLQSYLCIFCFQQLNIMFLDVFFLFILRGVL